MSSTKDYGLATFWRLSSVGQSFVTLGALLFASYLIITSQIWIDVEGERIPGRYQINELSDKEYMAFAEQFTNLIATYQFSNAQDQLTAAIGYLEPKQRDAFRRELLEKMLFAIQDTNRSQIFTIWDQQVTRQEQEVIITLSGTAQKQIANKLISYDLGYQVVVSVFPGETDNPYGLIVTDFAELQYS